MSDLSAPRNKSNFKLAAHVFLYTVFAAILNIVMYLSVMFIAEYLTTKTIGTRIYQIENGSETVVSEIYNDTGSNVENSEVSSELSSAVSSTDAAQQAVASDSSNTSETSSFRSEQIRTSMPGSVNSSVNILAQVLMIILLFSMPYAKIWPQGDRDCNSVNFGHMDKDMLRGLKIGLMAGIPSFIFYFILLICKIGKMLPDYYSLYRYLNISFLPLLNMIQKENVWLTGEVPWSILLILLLTLTVVPFSCFIAYILGFKQISVSEKIMYVNPDKKKKRRY